MKLLKAFADLSTGRILIFAVVVAAGYYFQYYNDGSTIEQTIQTTTANISTETATRTEIEKRMKREEEMRGNLMQLRRNLDVVKSKIPVDFKDAQMSSIINNASVVSGLRVVSLAIRPSVKSAPRQAADMSKINPEDLIEEVRFDIKLSGSYDSLISFLDVLAKEDKIIKVRNFTISRASPDDINNDAILFSGEIVGFKQVAFSGITGGTP